MQKFGAGFVLFIIFFLSGCQTTYYYNSAFQGKEWTPPAIAKPVKDQTTSRVGLVLEPFASSDTALPAGLKVGLDTVLGGYSEGGYPESGSAVGWNLAFGASAALATVTPAAIPTVNPSKGYSFSTSTPTYYSYGGTAQISASLLAGDPERMMISIGPSIGFSFERGTYYNARKQYVQYNNLINADNGYGSATYQFINTSDTGITMNPQMSLGWIWQTSAGSFINLGLSLGFEESNFPYFGSYDDSEATFKIFFAIQADLVRWFIVFGEQGGPTAGLVVDGGIELFLDGPPSWPKPPVKKEES